MTTFFGQVNEIHARVENGGAMTPFGRVPVAKFPDGSDVVVMIRPEALRLRPVDDADAVAGKVLASRLLGRSSWIHLCLGAHEATGPASGEAGHMHFHARVPGRFLPAEGEVLAIELDVTQAFVFAHTPPR